MLTGGYWAGNTLGRGRGVDPTCRVCGEHEDTVHQRAWVCTARSGIRSEVASPEHLRVAIVAGPDDLRFSRLLLEQPAILQGRARPLGFNLVFRHEVDGAQV